MFQCRRRQGGGASTPKSQKKRAAETVEERARRWRRWQEIAFGHLKFTPDVFYSMGIFEWYAAMDGYMESIGADRPENPALSGDFTDLDAYAAPSKSIKNEHH